MPTYDYECSRCGHTFELFQKMTDLPAETCPSCGGEVRRKIGSGAGLIFKGSGFYATDYRSSDYKTKAKSEKGDGSSSPKPDAPSTETKNTTDPPKESKGA
jgi:putative FmdB family regulatory protein